MALGDGIGREKGVKHWVDRRQRDYMTGAKAFMEWLFSNEKYTACTIDTDDHGIFVDVGLTKDNYFATSDDIFNEFINSKFR